MNYLELANKIDVDLDAKTFDDLPCKHCTRAGPCEYRMCLPFKAWFRDTWRRIVKQFNGNGKEFPKREQENAETP